VTRAPVIPLLYQPVIEAMHGAHALLSDLECQSDQADPAALLFKQEWAIEVMQNRPTELADSSHRPPP
jgi:hypothetical protein